MATEAKEPKKIIVDMAKYLKKHGDKKTKIRYAKRKSVEIIAATDHYSVGQVIAPHETFADYLIELKVAKVFKKKDEDEE